MTEVDVSKLRAEGRAAGRARRPAAPAAARRVRAGEQGLERCRVEVPGRLQPAIPLVVEEVKAVAVPGRKGWNYFSTCLST